MPTSGFVFISANNKRKMYGVWQEGFNNYNHTSAMTIFVNAAFLCPLILKWQRLFSYNRGTTRKHLETLYFIPWQLIRLMRSLIMINCITITPKRLPYSLLSDGRHKMCTKPLNLSTCKRLIIKMMAVWEDRRAFDYRVSGCQLSVNIHQCHHHHHLQSFLDHYRAMECPSVLHFSLALVDFISFSKCSNLICPPSSLLAMT